MSKAVQRAVAAVTERAAGDRVDGEPAENAPAFGILRAALPEPAVTLDDSGNVLDDELEVTLEAGMAMKRGHLKVGDVVAVIPVADKFLLIGASRSSDEDTPLPSDPPTGGGGGAARQEFVQAVPLQVWTIDYPSDPPPNVTVAVNGERVGADVSYLPDQRRILITFYAPTAGVAYLS